MIVITKSPDVFENTLDDDASEGFRSNDFDSFSAASTGCTSCSYISYNMKINDTQLYIQPIHGHTTDFLESVAASRVNIGSISVQNGTDVTFGNKTFFNAPVVIKQLVVDYVEQNNDESNIEPVKTKTPWRAKSRHYFYNHPCMVCSIFSALAMILATLILVGYFLEPFVEHSTCDAVPSNPTYYACGFASPCTRCQAMFPDKEICQAYYEHSCGDLRCFCKPECTSKNFRD